MTTLDKMNELQLHGLIESMETDLASPDLDPELAREYRRVIQRAQERIDVLKGLYAPYPAPEIDA